MALVLPVRDEPFMTAVIRLTTKDDEELILFEFAVVEPRRIVL
tara:strand:- start:470 stop:598 length:129 start_codon:yes stop_codon:yes gene_type:complete